LRFGNYPSSQNARLEDLPALSQVFCLQDSRSPPMAANGLTLAGAWERFLNPTKHTGSLLHLSSYELETRDAIRKELQGKVDQGARGPVWEKEGKRRCAPVRGGEGSGAVRL
jgi:hypothetical protein